MTETEPGEENSQRALTITKKNLLLVEGSDDWHFFTALLRHLEIDEVQIIRCGSRDEIRARITAVTVAPNFEIVERIGGVRDADEHAIGAFDSVCGALSAASLPVPQSEMDVVTATQPPAVSVFIMPGGGQPGMLETLLCQSFADPVIDECIDRFLDCAPDEDRESLKRLDKARANAFLCWREHPEVSVGIAAQRGYWDLGHSCFNSIKTFLQGLFGDGQTNSKEIGLR